VRAFVAFTLAFALGLAACGGEPEPSIRTVEGFPGAQVEVSGKPLYFECAGSGSPAIVLEAGLGTTSITWQAIRAQLEKLTRVCTYDRLGLGITESIGGTLGTQPRTARMQVEDLDRLLDQADVEAPYLFVGHSWGGALVRLFAFEHPDDVAGVVLLDAAHPDTEARFTAALPPRRPGEHPEISGLREELAARNDPARVPESLDWRKSNDQVREARTLGDLPLVVVTALGADEPGPLPRAVDRRVTQAWIALQRELAALSTNSLHVIAQPSSHFVQAEDEGQPMLVVAAVQAALAAARGDGRLPACEAVFHQVAARCVGS
jgi:pimeloyl-ACP methyl ester carboxylesterase